ncbi:rap guanine nucleotide exchange factor 6-like [Xenia sp. Carnegie-2017]|uniref:rap guanine nucleotide exchange factor 6-like n=1 Tax=Xenia sp. Carnegie-2017 TaxID=2897299 RepID=UPI001F03945B|nr:rap guanine nucleotide exchange factor 6-like [Xenia sp. Carnegie-2017]
MDRTSEKFINCLKRPSIARTDEDCACILKHLRGMQAMSGLGGEVIKAMCKTARYEVHESNHLLYLQNDYATCWYILLSGSVFIDCNMYLPGSSFGKQPLWLDGRRGSECLILEHSEMIVIDYPDSRLMKPNSRHSYEAMDLEMMLALENGEVKVGGPIPDEKIPQELDQVKQLLLKSSYGESDTSRRPQSGPDFDLDLSGLVESIVDSDDDETTSQSSGESMMVRDVVRDCLEKDTSERTENDIEALMDFLQHLPAFSSMTTNVRRELCAVMLFAVVEHANVVVLNDGDQLDSWCVILNGSVEVLVPGEETVTLHLGQSFGVQPTLDQYYHKGVMKTRVDDCQFVCIPQTEYHRILSQGEANIHEVVENGEVVMVTEYRSLDGGNRDGHVVIKAKPKLLVDHLVEDHSIVDPTYVEDFLLTYRTFFNEPSNICSQLLDWFDFPELKDKVTRVMLLWVINHFNSDFEDSPSMEKHLERFEKGLEKHSMIGQLRLLHIACSSKARLRKVTLVHHAKDSSLNFSITGGKDRGFGIFIAKVKKGSKIDQAGLRKGDQILEVNGQNFENMTLAKAKDILKSQTNLTISVKHNIAVFKELLNSPLKRSSHVKTKKGEVQRSSSDSCDKRQGFSHRTNDPLYFSDYSGKKLGNTFGSNMYATTRIKKTFLKFTTLPRSPKGEKDVKALYGISYDDSTLMNAKKHALGNGTLRAYSSSENIADEEIDSVQPDQVIRIYKADHTSKYFVIYQDTTVREVLNMAVDAFSLAESADNFSLSEISVNEGDLIKQKRLPDLMCDLVNKASLNGRYYLKDFNSTDVTLLPEEAIQELGKELRHTIADLDATEVARQVTLRDFQIFQKIESSQYIYELWKFEEKLRNTLTNFTKITDEERFWVITEICKEQNVIKRVKIIKQFIRIAKRCKDCRNFNSMFEIVSGLDHSAVQRMKGTWEKVPSKYTKIFDDIKDLMDPSRNMSKYRTLLSREQRYPPVIPFFPIVLKDLSFLHFGNKSIVDGLINFEKLRSISKEVRNTTKLSLVSYVSDMMFDRAVTDTPGPTVIQALTGGLQNKNRRSRRDNGFRNPRKMHEEVLMSRRVKKYLTNLEIITNEDELRVLSLICEPPAGSGLSAQIKKKLTPPSSPSESREDKEDIISQSSSVSSPASPLPPSSPGAVNINDIDVFPEVSSRPFEEQKHTLKRDDTLTREISIPKTPSPSTPEKEISSPRLFFAAGKGDGKISAV